MIRYASSSDFELLSKYENHICETEIKKCISTKRVLIMFYEDTFIGWLRFNLFWDNIPFINLLYFLEDYRRKGFGSRLVGFWENEMLKSGHKIVLTSTQSNEQAQFFYRKIGYTDCGSLLLPGDPLEIIMLKKLSTL
ncbi:MAG: GNAT family N-acetyltransferase [Lachnospiraceae bacterium]|nr:GNAT family N-acetyltransferase [Lachnospiraceae bacterium]